MKENELIAEFMGVGKLYEAQSSNQWNQYHTSWDCLMLVINKIRSMDSTYEVEEVGKYNWDSEISHYEFNLDLTYESVVEFIKNNKTNK